jgi:hypothetical protein
MAFVAVYDKRTGRKHSVPEHWLDHPVLGQNIRKTPLSESQQRKADAHVEKAATVDTPAAGDKE